ncbi:DNA-binding protein [Nocardioides oleivorans]|uniref:DNA-binding protein n=1 Tax=Nocardioides oleivorans TaxID=273676 RepID=A0A4Q2RQP9_9ACTN|nr:helix-turn-helix domain-containing protein [Nocardioides oleivorans]RYB91008.1 DNA-binding protein [Nocardioides oleivorans]
MDELLRIDAVASWLGVSENTLRYWRAQGTGPTSGRMGRHLVYRRTDVQEYIDSLFAKAVGE